MQVPQILALLLNLPPARNLILRGNGVAMYHVVTEDYIAPAWQLDVFL